ncbi:MAG: aspartate aminotransferase family protein [Saprospiraceae bacterium]|nr:aspartate aminotransferase family protein [Saprospiraceae bacterium]MCB9321019.1 aspartate aminotransferase family protein [Lewinellaceae bacterium]
MDNSTKLHERRKSVVPRGVGVFNPATAVSAKNAIVVDADGRELIDFAGGIGVQNAGHCPEPVVAAICEQAQKLIHTCFNVATYDVYMELAEELISLFPHGEHTKVMLTTTGAESVENAVKIARQHTGRSAIVAFTDGFHGRSMMAMTLTSKVSYKLGCGPFAPEVYHLPYPNYNRYNDGLDMDQFVERETRRLRESLINRIAPNNVAAVIIELVQGEGGFVVAPVEYVRELRKICDEFGIVLIIDEVQSGFGRTGKWGAYQHYNITPDISVWAKSMGAGMPIGCVMGRADIMDSALPGTIGGTYLGNPVCAAAALANIRFMQSIDINARARHVGEIVRTRFEDMNSRIPAIGDIRGLGAMLAFSLVKNKNPQEPDADLTRRLVLACLDRGLILISAGVYGNVIRILSPLTISDDHLKRGLDILDEELVRLSA